MILSAKGREARQAIDLFLAISRLCLFEHHILTE